jgi:hypothetical protein
LARPHIDILLPPRYIDYILAHELVHLAAPRGRIWRVYWGDPLVVPRPRVRPGAEDPASTSP